MTSSQNWSWPVSVGAGVASNISGLELKACRWLICQPRPQGFSLKKWLGREKSLASAGHVYSLNITEKLIYMQPADFGLTEVAGSKNGK